MPGVSASGIKLLESITAAKIWAETDLQYFFGDDTAADLDTEFARDIRNTFPGTPDASFAFSAVAIRAFQMIDTVSNLNFSQTLDTSLADDVLVSISKPKSTTEGFFDFPGTAFHDGTTDSWSIGAFNSGLDYMLADAEVGGGEYANWTVLHEIGHSLGLKHTHKETAGLPPLPTVGKFMDNERYSVMSYNGASDGTVYGHAVTFMALDVAALQSLYGAQAYATGDSFYTLSNAKTLSLNLAEGSATVGRAYYCIWDTGGHDSIGYANFDKSVLINLNAATLDTAEVAPEVKDVVAAVQRTDYYSHLSKQLQQEIVDPWHHAGGFFSRVLDTKGGNYQATDGGFSIAHGVMIEDAVGGAAADLLIGNQGANTLFGNSGNDTLLGSGGSDKLIGDTQNDLLDGGKGNDFLDGGEGRDVFVFSNGYRIDEIAQFEHNRDVIDLSRLSGVSNFADLRHHMSVVNWDHDSVKDVEIKFGKDMLFVDDIKPSALTSSDFII
jgi:Ca2+-binding RTX toxin-like protein